MTSGQKAAVSLLTAVAVFSAFTIASFAGVFSSLETRFYQPAKIKEIRKQLDSAAESDNTYIETLLNRFGLNQDSFARDYSVETYLEQSPSSVDVMNRTKTLGMLLEQTPGLDGIRIVDSNGRSVHFSTFASDVMKQTDSMRIYKNYADLLTEDGAPETDYQNVSAADSSAGSNSKYRIFFDDKHSRIIFSFPFYDKFQAYRGTILFYVAAQDFERTLVTQNILSLNDRITLVAGDNGQTGGFVLGMPSVGRDILEKAVSDKWKTGSSGPDKLAAADTQNAGSVYWILITSEKSGSVKTAGIYPDSLFIMPQAVRFILLGSVFITLFLIIFLIFSLKPDDMVVIRDKIRRFQFALVNEYLENRENVDWNTVSRQIAGRKQEVSSEIRKSLGRRAKRHEKETDELLDRSWNDIITALSGRPSAAPSIASASSDSAEIKKMLEEILSSGTIKVQAIQSPVANSASAVSARVPSSGKRHSVPAAEPVEELTDAEPAEELADAEPVEELADAEPVEELTDAEPVEDVADAEPVEELADAEPVEELTDAEPVEDVADAEPVEDVADAEPVEDVADAEPVEELADAEPVEELTDAEPVEDVADAEPVEELADAEPVEDVADAEPVEELADAEPVEELETVDDAQKNSEINSQQTINIDEFIANENKEDKFPVPGDFFNEPLTFGEPAKQTTAVPGDSISDFKVANPDFSFLDGVGKQFMPNEQQPEAELEEVDISEFGMDSSGEKDTELHEIPTFSSASPNPPKKNAGDISFTIEPGMPDYSELDGKSENKSEQPKHLSMLQTASAMLRDNKTAERPSVLKTASEMLGNDTLTGEKLTTREKALRTDSEQHMESTVFAQPMKNDTDCSAQNVEPLEKNGAGFGFTSFGANNDCVTDLSAAPDAIIEGSDGVFHISSNISVPAADNSDFKKLVDSVLK